MLENSENATEKVSAPYEQHKYEGKIRSFGFRFNPRKIARSEGLDRWRLRNAASLNDVDRLNELLKSGVDPNAADESGRTALHLACCRGYSDIVTSLLSHKADCNVVDKLGNTPLHLAVCTTSTATINLLLKAGSSVLAQENNGCTPLRLAQSKLWLLRRHMPKDCENLKQQVSDVIEMMKKLVDKESKEAELLGSFNSSLSLVKTSNQVTDDLKKLLDDLDALHINQTHSLSQGLTSAGSSGLKSSLQQLCTLQNDMHPS